PSSCFDSRPSRRSRLALKREICGRRSELLSQQRCSGRWPWLRPPTPRSRARTERSRSRLTATATTRSTRRTRTARARRISPTTRPSTGIRVSVDQENLDHEEEDRDRPRRQGEKPNRKQAPPESCDHRIAPTPPQAQQD